jgi:PAS domain S-box-containing protein
MQEDANQWSRPWGTVDRASYRNRYLERQRIGSSTRQPAAATGPLLHSAIEAKRHAPASIDERIFATSLDLILVVDRVGTLLRVSPSSASILGYQPEEMVGRSAADFLHPDDLENTRSEMRLARRGQLTRNFECRYHHKDGRTIPLAWTGVWSEVDAQHFFIGRDMTERFRLESQLRQAQKMEALGQLTGGIAHDFNNMLTTIIAMTDLLADELAHDPKHAEMVKTIDEAAERGAELVHRLMAFSRKQPLSAQSLDLNEVVTRMVAILQPTLGEDIRVTTALGPDLWPALADAHQLEDAIVNLAVNARDAMPKGGELVIETANVHLDEQYAARNVEVAPGDYVAVVVTDSGDGMAPDVIERAFEPFFTTKGEGRGTGLGLSMVYGFAKQSRGHVKIYSELGHGTSIKVYLPRAVAAAAAVVERPVVGDPRSAGGETILIVEDDAAVRIAAVTILENLGYRVLEAEDGRAALAILGSPEPIDLLFTDLVMPNGMSGQDLVEQARRRRPSLKALFTSGYSAPVIEARGSADPSVPLLGKPYRKQKLGETVRRVLDGAG